MSALRRASRADTSRRAAIMIARATIKKTNDKTKLQEADVELLDTEAKVSVERFQQYGFSARPRPPEGENKKAEALIVFPTGTRSHGVIIAIDDRRYRLKEMAEGEVALYDDQGQVVHIKRGGMYVSGGPKKLPITVEVGNAKINVADGNVTQQVGGAKLEHTASGWAFTGGTITNDGKAIDKTHVHTGVESGPSNTGVPA